MNPNIAEIGRATRFVKGDPRIQPRPPKSLVQRLRDEYHKVLDENPDALHEYLTMLVRDKRGVFLKKAEIVLEKDAKFTVEKTIRHQVTIDIGIPVVGDLPDAQPAAIQIPVEGEKQELLTEHAVS